MNRVIVLVFLLGVFFSSCEDFLTARDKSSILEDDLFTDQEGIEEAMYGLYVTLAKGDMYGETFQQTIDLLGQYFAIGKEAGSDASAGGIYDKIIMHDHTDQRAIDRYKKMWQTSYKFVSDVNKILERLEIWDGKRLKHEKMYKGEALGVRAYVLFDLLRMYGSALEENRGIPYVTQYGMYVTPFSTTGECYEKIIADLKLAEQLLVEDKQLLVYPRLPENMYDLFASERVSHFNLYAVKATLARVYWTRGRAGDLDSAGMYAREVIESGRFPLPSDGTTISSTHFIRCMGGTVNADEAIFGLYVSNMYDNWSGELLLQSGGWLPAEPEMYKRRDDKFDYRNEWIGVPNIYNMSLADRIRIYGDRYLKVLDRVLINPGDKDLAGIGFNGANMIRIPEMYLILVESLVESSPEEAKIFFNKYYASRGMGNFEGDLTIEIIDEEFRKEFVLEGQYWFRLKKRQPDKLKLVPQIGGELIMDEDKWNLNIPDEEFEYRDESTY